MSSVNEQDIDLASARISAIESDPEAMALVKAIMARGHTAEGVRRFMRQQEAKEAPKE